MIQMQLFTEIKTILVLYGNTIKAQHNITMLGIVLNLHSVKFNTDDFLYP